MVLVTGLEPVRLLQQGILSPWCLPIPPRREINKALIFFKYTKFYVLLAVERFAVRAFNLYKYYNIFFLKCQIFRQSETRLYFFGFQCVYHFHHSPMGGELGFEPRSHKALDLHSIYLLLKSFSFTLYKYYIIFFIKNQTDFLIDVQLFV